MDTEWIGNEEDMNEHEKDMNRKWRRREQEIKRNLI